MTAGPFSPTVESLRTYRCPEWFRDAKFGIFLHWGVNTVAGFNGLYEWFMHYQHKPPVPGYASWFGWGAPVYPHHVATYGHPTQFGYKDFIPMWKAEQFDPQKLGAYFQQIGAKYIVPVGVHCDNFDNFNSKYHRWNSVQLGPKRDIIGEWRKTCQSLGLRFGVSEHVSNFIHMSYEGTSDFDGPWAHQPYDTVDPLYSDLYVNRPLTNRASIDPAFKHQWYYRIRDLIETYDPDLFYIDGALPFQGAGTGRQIVTHFLNSNAVRRGKEAEAALCIKDKWENGACIQDFEAGQSDKLKDRPWQTDTSLNSGWFYLGEKMSKAGGQVAGMTLGGGALDLSGPVIIHNLCDIVSKNGNLLLNIGLRADGSLPDNQKAELDIVGAWLQKNGEAIFETRPWVIYGEGPSKISAGSFNQNKRLLTASDIRFTTKENSLYALVMGWPPNGTVLIASLAAGGTWQRPIQSIQMVGWPGEVKWTQTDKGLLLTFPNGVPLDHAYAVKIS